MKKALRLAERGVGKVHPNPLVGAVLVKNGRIIGEGAHEKFGGPHAEVMALRKATRPAGSTLYVTLEPCPHTGKTPPCTELLLKEKVRRVVIAAKDPNPIVSGKGIRTLKKNGVSLVTGVLEKEALELNKDYRHWMNKKTPYVILKFAQSLDGKIADLAGHSRWISSPASRALAHKLRSQSDAILVGIHTVLKDDPLLSVRSTAYRGVQPLKVILDSDLRLPLTARLFSKASPGAVLVATTTSASSSKFKALQSKAEVIRFSSKNGRVDLAQVMRFLGKRGVVSLLVEGGAEVIADALAQKVAHEIYCFTAPILLGGKKAPGSVGGEGFRLMNALKLRDVRIQTVGQDILVRGKI